MSEVPSIKDHSGPMSFLRASVRVAMSRARGIMTAHRGNRMARKAFMNTFYLDDRMLDDIGVTREEVEWAASLPLHVNASDALSARVRKRRAGEAG